MDAKTTGRKFESKQAFYTTSISSDCLLITKGKTTLYNEETW